MFRPLCKSSSCTFFAPLSSASSILTHNPVHFLSFGQAHAPQNFLESWLGMGVSGSISKFAPCGSNRCAMPLVGFVGQEVRELTKPDKASTMGRIRCPICIHSFVLN